MATTITTDYSNDDFQDVDLDIDSLYQKYIKPIEVKRSQVSANPVGGNNNAQMTNAPYESRCHTFLRMLGMPVMADDGTFYNPGYNPTVNVQKTDAQKSVDSKISQAQKQAHQNRENAAKNALKIFSDQGLDAVTYSIILADRTAQRKFNVFDDSTFPDIDQQKYKYNTDDALRPYVTKANEPLKVSVSNHILRPLTTNPVICDNVAPMDRRISVPFLSKTNAEYSKNEYTKFCGLAMIIQQRLLEPTTQTYNGMDVINNFLQISGYSTNDLSDVATVINDDKLSQTIKYTDLANNSKYRFSFNQLTTLNTLTKLLKGLVKIYVESINELENIKKQTIWLPLCNAGGPENGVITDGGVDFASVTWQENWQKIDGSYWDLLSKQSTAQQVINPDFDESDYAIPGCSTNNILSYYDKEIKKLKSKKVGFNERASKAYKTIELVMGNVSGLGILDIVAIYITLWAVDVKYLVALLDDPSQKRMEDYSTELKAAMLNVDHTIPGADALTEIENKLASVLAHADMWFDNEVGNAECQDTSIK